MTRLLCITIKGKDYYYDPKELEAMIRYRERAEIEMFKNFRPFLK